MDDLFIKDYFLEAPLQNKNAGFSRWTFAKKGTQEFFLKEFLNPVYPADDVLSRDVMYIRRKECNEYEKARKELYSCINAASDGHLVRIQDFFRWDSHYYIATEKVESLEMSAEEISKLPFQDILILCLGIAHGLMMLHEAHIVHADIKETNVLLERTANHRISGKVVDFDGAFFEGTLIDPDELGGDFVYLSPEACRYILGESVSLTCKMDVFALGLLFHQYFTGAFPDFDKEEYEYAHIAVLEKQKLGLSERLPKELRNLIEWMLQCEISDRCSMEQVYNELKNINRLNLKMLSPEEAAKEEKPASPSFGHLDPPFGMNPSVSPNPPVEEPVQISEEPERPFLPADPPRDEEMWISPFAVQPEQPIPKPEPPRKEEPWIAPRFDEPEQPIPKPEPTRSEEPWIAPRFDEPEQPILIMDQPMEEPVQPFEESPVLIPAYPVEEPKQESLIPEQPVEEHVQPILTPDQPMEEPVQSIDTLVQPIEIPEQPKEKPVTPMDIPMGSMEEAFPAFVKTSPSFGKTDVSTNVPIEEPAQTIDEPFLDYYPSSEEFSYGYEPQMGSSDDTTVLTSAFLHPNEQPDEAVVPEKKDPPEWRVAGQPDSSGWAAPKEPKTPDRWISPIPPEPRREEKKEVSNAAGKIVIFARGIEYQRLKLQAGVWVSLGRSEVSSNICLPANMKAISRVHCQVMFDENGRFWVVDRSTNGTWSSIHTRLVKDKVTEVRAGTKLYLGDIENRECIVHLE